MSGLFGVTVESYWQIWRYVTFQFLHSPRDFLHIVFNMVGLYFLGTVLERSWGSRRFLRFYLTCGVVAGLAYVIIGTLFPRQVPSQMPIIGASGGVYGLVLACAILFPQFQVILLFFVVPIRVVATILVGVMILMVVRALAWGEAYAAMSHVAHLGGAAAAAVWIWVLPRLRGSAGRAKVRAKTGAWDRKVRRRAEEEAHVDEILQKIKDHGIASLSRAEKRTLQEATRRQRDEERHIRRL